MDISPYFILYLTNQCYFIIRLIRSYTSKLQTQQSTNTVSGLFLFWVLQLLELQKTAFCKFVVSFLWKDETTHQKSRHHDRWYRRLNKTISIVLSCMIICRASYEATRRCVVGFVRGRLQSTDGVQSAGSCTLIRSLPPQWLRVKRNKNYDEWQGKIT